MTTVDPRPATEPFAITLEVGSSLLNETGSWRSERPIYVDLLPPCNQGCPAGENVQQPRSAEHQANSPESPIPVKTASSAPGSVQAE